MAIVANLTALLKLDTTGFVGGLQGAIKSVHKFNRKLTFASRDIQAAGANLTALTAPIALIGATSVMAAADAEEAGTKFDFTFREISDSANDMVKSLSKDFDLASSSTRKLLGDTGDILAGFGFTQKEALKLSGEIVRLGGDLASFQNIEGGVSEAVSRLTKGVLGQTRNLNLMGIVVRRQTKEFMDSVKEIERTTGATRQAAEAQAILKVAMNQSKNAVGDYARTSGSLQNRLRALGEQFKDIRVAIGEFLIEGLDLPKILKSISNRVKQVIAFIKNASPAIKEFVSKFLALLVVVGPILAVLGSIGLSITGIVAGFLALKAALIGIGGFLVTTIGFFASLSWPVWVAIAAISALTATIIKMSGIDIASIFSIDSLKKAFMTFIGFIVNIKENWKILTKFIVDVWQAVWENFPTIIKTVGNNLLANLKTLTIKISAVLGAVGTFLVKNWEVTLGKVLNAIIEFAVKAIDTFFKLGEGIGKVLFKAITAALKGKAAVRETITKGVKEGLAIGFKQGLTQPTIKGAIKDALALTPDFVSLLEGLENVLPQFPGFVTTFSSAAKAIEKQQKRATAGTGQDPQTKLAQATTKAITGIAKGSVEAFRVRAGTANLEKETAENTKETAEGVQALTSVVRSLTGLDIVVDIP